MHWKKQHVIGVGSYGPVHLAAPINYSAKNSSTLAVKSSEVENSSRLRKEGKILNELKGSPYIVRCFGEDESFEYEVARYAYQLLMGIRHVHNKGFFHCEIKPSNLLVFPTNNKLIKIADFGSALRATEVPRELHEKRRIFDVCCIGCVVVKMLTGDPTYWYTEDIEKYQEALLCYYPDEFMDSTVSNMTKDFVRNCLRCKNPGRLIVDELINHPFIQNAITENHEELMVSSVNNNSFGDWVSKHGLFTTSGVDEPKRKAKLGDESKLINSLFASKEFMEADLTEIMEGSYAKLLR
ncbi:mitogen-activated protein kinase kinase kinase 20-like [Lycium ferocissimum]|uniref:mitogen-activated protein kinase kinase kinase 20-like n=1 Tax=Lycium ferocissimum TaxID=112874 RepID=UPI00281611C7|nr:mitogen-activated protein kinase kinase kinase 20-like [Lycium ferocissimum]